MDSLTSEEIDIEESFSNISISEKDKSRTTKVDVDLFEYTVISKYFGEEIENNQLIYLPTPESLQKLTNFILLKDLVKFDINKYKSLFIDQSQAKSVDENEEKELESSFEQKIVLDLDKIPSIQEISMVSIVLVFLGGINSQNDIYIIFPNDMPQNPDEKCYIDYCSNYAHYIFNTVLYLKKQQINFPYSDMNLLFKSLEEMGITIIQENKSVLYRNIKDAFMSLSDNKILIILAPSNNFWVKSEKNSLNGINYDKKLNNYCNIFYNKNFIKKFLTLVANHPRCNLCLMSSMTHKNLKAAIDGLDVQFNKFLPKKFSMISQGDHDVIKPVNKKEMPLFFRNMERIINHVKQKDKWEYFDEKNILILEGDKNKITEGTMPNTLLSNLFSEEYLKCEKDKKILVEKEGDKMIRYVVTLLENCSVDIREYLAQNPYNEFKE